MTAWWSNRNLSNRFFSSTSAEPASPAAVLKDIRFSYDRGTSWALDGVSLTVHAGERLCLVGPNGSGKSTLARLIAGLTAPDGGEVTLLGQRVYAAGPNADAYRAARHGIGMVFQNPEDQLVTTVLEDDVAFGPENLGLERELIGERIVDSLQAVGLANLRQSDPTRMSGGQQQRASIAGMLAMNPAMLVLDEPTAMLDPQGRREVLRTIRQLGDQFGITVVLITHYMDEAAQAERVVVMDKGKIILDDTPSEVFSHVDMLREVGLDVPQVTQLMYLMDHSGFEGADTHIINEEECSDYLYSLLSANR